MTFVSWKKLSWPDLFPSSHLFLLFLSFSPHLCALPWKKSSVQMQQPRKRRAPKGSSRLPAVAKAAAAMLTTLLLLAAIVGAAAQQLAPSSTSPQPSAAAAGAPAHAAPSKMTAAGAGAAAAPAAADDASANKTKAKTTEEASTSTSTSTICPSIARSPTRHVVLVVTGATYVLADDDGKEAASSKEAKATDSRRLLEGMLAVNGSVLGPTLEFEEGEDVSVDVVNEVAGNGNASSTTTATSVHWHGLDLPGSAWADGVSGVTQRPVPRGVSFRYRFKAGPVGTHWYHAREYCVPPYYFVFEERRPHRQRNAQKKRHSKNRTPKHIYLKKKKKKRHRAPVRQRPARRPHRPAPRRVQKEKERRRCEL